MLQPYIELPFPLVNQVVTTIFHGKQKKLINTLKNLFPVPLAYELGKKKASYYPYYSAGGGFRLGLSRPL